MKKIIILYILICICVNIQAQIQDEALWTELSTIEEYNVEFMLPTQTAVRGWDDRLELSYSLTGKLEEVTFKDHTKSIIYRPDDDLLESMTDVDGQITTYDYDSQLRLDYISRRNGKVTTAIEYGYQPNYIKTTSSFKNTVTNAIEVENIVKENFDGLGRTVSTVLEGHTQDGSDVTLSITYDEMGREESQTNALGHTFTTDYYKDALNRVETKTDAMGFVTRYSYEANPTTNYTYTPNSLLKTTITDPEGYSVSKYTDDLGRLIMERKQKEGSSLLSSIRDQFYDYDKKGRVKRITPPGGLESGNNSSGWIPYPELVYEYEYDGADNILSKKIPDKGVTDYNYNERNLMITMQEPLLESELSTNDYMCYEYDSYGRLKRQGIGDGTGVIDDNRVMIENFYDGEGTGNINNIIYKGKMDKKVVSILEGFLPGSENVQTTYAFDSYGRINMETQYRKEITNGIPDTYVEGQTNYTYDGADNVKEKEDVITLNTSTLNAIRRVETNTYDLQGRLRTNSLRLADPNNTNLFDETKGIINNDTYDVLDRVVYGVVGDNLHHMQYSFNANGWLTDINPWSWSGGSAVNPTCTTSTMPTVTNSDTNVRLFSLKLKYNNPTQGGQVLTNGLISEMHWKVKGREGQYYTYQYDNAQRLSNATYSTDSDATSGLYNTSYTYDKRGNIETLTRDGLVKQEECYIPMRIDDLTYEYEPNTNRLIKIVDEAIPYCPDYLRVENPLIKAGIYAANIALESNANIPSNKNVEYRANELVTLESGFEFGSDGGYGFFLAQAEDCPEENAGIDSSIGWGFLEGAGDQTYFYDVNGNIIEDKNKGFTFEYNILNQPYKAMKGGEENKIEWLWTADGRKLRKVVTINGAEETRKRYIKGIEIKNDRLDAIYHGSGRVKYENNNLRWQYNLTDHLGNVRLVIEDKDGSGYVNNNSEVLQENHYYPFGMQMTGVWLEEEGIEQDYGYNGKEETTDLDLGYLDFGFRQYDPTIGRFTGVDPISEQFSHVSTYNYAENEPVANIDLWGLQKKTRIRTLEWKGTASFAVYSNQGGAPLYDSPTAKTPSGALMLKANSELIFGGEAVTTQDGNIVIQAIPEGDERRNKTSGGKLSNNTVGAQAEYNHENGKLKLVGNIKALEITTVVDENGIESISGVLKIGTSYELGVGKYGIEGKLEAEIPLNKNNLEHVLEYLSMMTPNMNNTDVVDKIREVTTNAPSFIERVNQIYNEIQSTNQAKETKGATHTHVQSIY